MSQNDPTTSPDSAIRSELLFLIARFLSKTPCAQAANALIQELQTHQLLPRGFDWEGNERTRSYDQLVRLNSHIGDDHLLQIVRRVGPLLDQVVPTSAHGVQSLLSAGSMSLLRTPESVKKNLRWNLSEQMILQNGRPRVLPVGFKQPSLVQSLHARRAIGGGLTASTIPTFVYQNINLYDTKCGHLQPAYCSIFDRTGQYVFTGADDALVKIWHFRTGRLLATLRGHALEVSDLAVNYENTLLVSGSYDKVLRVWCLRTKAPVAVLQGHTNQITTVVFSPQCKGDNRILLSTGADGCVCFWQWNVATNHFNPKPKKFVERSHAGAKMLCASFSAGGMFAATGSSDHVVRVYFLYAETPTKICELEAHNDMVGCISYSNFSNHFISGSDDSTARIWHYERQEWKEITLNMHTKLNDAGEEVLPVETGDPLPELNVTMIAWNKDDSLVGTAMVKVNPVDYVCIKIWEARSGKLLHDLKRGHEVAVYVLEASPVDPRIMVSCGHDGHIFIWDIMAGVKIRSFHNIEQERHYFWQVLHGLPFEGQGSIPIFDCKFTPDGQGLVAADSFGQVLFLGFGVNEKIKEVPTEVFFHTDYRPLIRDANNFVLDEQTQLAPHLMPPPYLINVRGTPYPAAIQRLVPGRENMSDDQLVPVYFTTEGGISMVLGDGVDANNVLSGDEEPPAPVAAAAEPAPEEVDPRQRGNSRRQRVSSRRLASNNRGRAGNNRRPPAQADNTLQAGQAAGAAAQERAAVQVVAQPQDHDYSRHRHQDENNAEGNDRTGGDGDLQWNNRQARSSIDEMIRQLQREQDERILAQGGELPVASPPHLVAAADAHNERSRSLEGREGERELPGNNSQEQGNNQEQVPDPSVTRLVLGRDVIPPLNVAELKTSEEKRTAMAEEEIRKYIQERKKKQSVPNTPSTLFGNMSRSKQVPAGRSQVKKTNRQEQAVRNRLATRALYDTEEEETEESEESIHDSDSSYSDWTMEGSSNLQPPKRRSQRKPKRRRISSTEDEDEDEEEELAIEYDDDDDDDDDDDNDDEDYRVYTKRSKKAVEVKEEPMEEERKKGSSQDKKSKKPYKRATKTADKGKKAADKETKKTSSSSKAKSKKASKRKPEIDKNNLPVITELKEEFKPPDWLTGTIPRKTPFVPQMGDEVMYFRQGHELYLQAVEKHKSYEISSNISLPWQKNPHLREVELVKIVGIRYEVKPPRLCSLKLAYINPDTSRTSGGSFSVRYHDMPDVIDFLVLRQHFDLASRRNWKPGNRFQSMIDDQWWMGKIESRSPLNSIFQDSPFQCFYVKWDNGEYERLSPWDMEPVNANLLPNDVGGGVPVDPEELRGVLYTPKPTEWSSAGFEAETERILRGLDAVMHHSAAEPFNAPVDLSAFPLYAMIIEYPIDLSTIKARLENGYYRRINALQWDVRHIESNAKKFNEDGTPISRSAGIVTDTLLKFIGDPGCKDPMPILEQLSNGQHFNWEGGGGADDGGAGGGDSEGEGPSTSASTSTKRRRVKEESKCSRRQQAQVAPDPCQWKKDCSDLLATIMASDDASPFMAPVDPQVYPHYYDIIDTPMDFGTVKAKLDNGEYSTPPEFTKDVRLIFHNSRIFNTNRRSRIYSMTMRLSSMFEERMHQIVSSWRTLSKNKNCGTSGSGTQSSTTPVDSTSQAAHSSHSRDSTSQDSIASGSRPGPSTGSRTHTSGRSSEEAVRSLARSMVSRPADDTDSEKTEVEEEEEVEDKEMEVAEQGTDDEKYNEDEDTEIDEENSNTFASPDDNAPSASSASSSQSQPTPGPSQVSNGHASYRTRAKTGSLRPKRYISSEEEEERDVRKNGKRAPSYSSRDSSFQHDNEDVDVSTECSTESDTTSDTGSSTSKQRKRLSKAVHRKRKKAASNRKKTKCRKILRVELPTDEDSDNETEESESDTDSDEPPPRKPKPRRRTELDIDKSSSGRKSSSSGKRTTRNQGKRTFNYLEDSYDEYEDDPSCVSVSSRGRVRKMTKRARANRMDD